MRNHNLRKVKKKKTITTGGLEIPFHWTASALIKDDLKVLSHTQKKKELKETDKQIGVS